MTQENKQATLTEKERMLLRQSLPYMALSNHVYRTADTQAPKGWKIIAASDDSFARIYQRTDPGIRPRYAVAIRGTELRDKRALKADLQIARRKPINQSQQVLNFIDAVCQEKKINPADMAYTGHSLGGRIAIEAGKHYGSKNIWAINAPGPSAKIENEIESNKKISGILAAPGPGWVQIRSKGDLISAFGGNFRGATTINIDTKGPQHILASLHHAVSQELGEKLAEPVTARSRLFNALVIEPPKRLALSPTTQRVFNRLMDDGHRGKKPQSSLAITPA